LLLVVIVKSKYGYAHDAHVDQSKVPGLEATLLARLLLTCCRLVTSRRLQGQDNRVQPILEHHSRRFRSQRLTIGSERHELVFAFCPFWTVEFPGRRINVNRQRRPSGNGPYKYQGDFAYS